MSLSTKVKFVRFVAENNLSSRLSGQDKCPIAVGALSRALPGHAAQSIAYERNLLYAIFVNYRSVSRLKSIRIASPTSILSERPKVRVHQPLRES